MKGLLRRFWSANSSVFAIAQTVFANILIQGSNIACGVMSARTLGPAGRGELAAVIMWPQLLAYALTLGTPLSYIYYVKKRPDLSRELSGASIMLSLASGLVGSLIGCIIIPFSLHTYPPSMIHFAQVMVFLAPVGLCSITLSCQIQASGAFVRYNLFRFLSPVSILVVIAVLRISHTLTATTAAFAYLLAGFPALGWLIYMVVKQERPVFRKLGESTRLMLGYGVRAWGADLLGTVASQVDRVLVVSMLTPESMGLYVVTQSAASLLGVIPNAVNPVILPRIASRSPREIVHLVGAAVRMTCFLTFLASLPLALGGRFLFHFVYGGKFDGAAIILPFLLVEAIFDAMTSVLSQAFLAAGMPGMVTFLQGCGVCSAIPLMYVLIPRYGVRGAACALMMATIIRFTFIMINFPLRMKVRPPNPIIGRKELITFIKTRQLVPITQDT